MSERLSIEELEPSAQRVLDQLRSEDLLPFELSVGSILDQGDSEYRVHFYDSRMRSVEFSWTPDQSFESVFREAVLGRVMKISGPLAARFKAVV
jgi:hypothetical protein